MSVWLGLAVYNIENRDAHIVRLYDLNTNNLSK
ncbi:hypothetical protein ZORO111903_01075 [Zobellia roscoffensis]